MKTSLWAATYRARLRFEAQFPARCKFNLSLISPSEADDKPASTVKHSRQALLIRLVYAPNMRPGLTQTDQ